MSKTGLAVEGMEWKGRILGLVSKGSRRRTRTRLILVKLYNVMD